MTEEQKRDLDRASMDAWERADADAVMRLMADDCEHRASVGPQADTIRRGPGGGRIVSIDVRRKSPK